MYMSRACTNTQAKMWMWRSEDDRWQFFFPPGGSLGSNSGHYAWWQTPSPAKPSCHSHPNFQLSFSVKVPCLYVRNNLKTHNSFEKPHMEILSSKHLTSFKTQKKQTGLFFSQASITVFTICKTLLKHRFCLLLFLAFIYIPPISKQMEGS